MKNILMTTVALSLLTAATPAFAMTNTENACMAEAKTPGSTKEGTYSRYVNCLGKKDYDLEHSSICVTYKRKHDEARAKGNTVSTRIVKFNRHSETDSRLLTYWTDEQEKYFHLLQQKCKNN